MEKFSFFAASGSNLTVNIFDETNNELTLTISEAEKKFNIQWIEFNSETPKIYHKLQVRFMGSELGWGLFAKMNIESGETLGVFTGKIYMQDRSKIISSDHVFLSDAPDHKFQIVDASDCGNLTRFIQHLPSRE